MNETSYTKSFIISLCIILAFIIGSYYFGQIFLEKVSPKVKETIIALDMDQYKVQGNDQTKPVSDPGGSSAPKKTVKQEQKQDVEENVTDEVDATPYDGGIDDSADVTTDAATDQGAVSSEGTGVEGKGTAADEGDGTGNGGKGSGKGSGDSVGDGENGGHGYIDVQGYIAKLNSIKHYPVQALRRNLTGTSTYSVTFNAQGDVVSASLVSGSGYSVLDNAAYRLIMSGGRIINTTGKSATITVPIVWRLE